MQFAREVVPLMFIWPLFVKVWKNEISGGEGGTGGSGEREPAVQFRIPSFMMLLPEDTATVSLRFMLPVFFRVQEMSPFLLPGFMFISELLKTSPVLTDSGLISPPLQSIRPLLISFLS